MKMLLNSYQCYRKSKIIIVVTTLMWKYFSIVTNLSLPPRGTFVSLLKFHFRDLLGKIKFVDGKYP